MSSPDPIRETVADVLAARPEVRDGYLFGSFARGDAAAHSDIDVAVYMDPVSAEARIEILTELMAALGRNDVDLVILNDAPPVLYHRVLRDGVRVLSRDPRATTTREGYALSRYCDYVPQLRKIEAATKARQRAEKFGR